MASFAVPRGSHDLYWWHGEVLDALRYCGPAGYSTKGIASSLQRSHGDVVRYCADLAEQGYVSIVPAQWEIPGDPVWYAVTAAAS